LPSTFLLYDSSFVHSGPELCTLDLKLCVYCLMHPESLDILRSSCIYVSIYPLVHLWRR